jgi:hypothetical protein
MIDGAYIAGADGVRVVVGVDRNPDRGPLERPASTGIHGAVCGSCGFVEFYVNQPGELYEAYLRAERSHRTGAPTAR